jgi:hypothetical protein
MPHGVKGAPSCFRFYYARPQIFEVVLFFLLLWSGARVTRLIVIQRRKHAGASPRSGSNVERASGAQQGPELSESTTSFYDFLVREVHKAAGRFGRLFVRRNLCGNQPVS